MALVSVKGAGSRIMFALCNIEMLDIVESHFLTLVTFGPEHAHNRCDCDFPKAITLQRWLACGEGKPKQVHLNRARGKGACDIILPFGGVVLH